MTADSVHIVDIEQRTRGVVVIRRQCCMVTMSGVADCIDVTWAQHGPTEVYAKGSGSAHHRRVWRRALARRVAQDPSLTFCGDWRRR